MNSARGVSFILKNSGFVKIFKIINSVNYNEKILIEVSGRSQNELPFLIYVVLKKVGLKFA